MFKFCEAAGEFLRRHPLVREVLIWSIPAVVFGVVLRMLFLWYSPYAYWGSDSRSFFGFTNGVLTEFYFSLNEKRRYLYPILLLPVSLLPGGTLRWLAVLQAVLGVVTILPFAYLVRKVFAGWKVWMIPLTLLFAGLPVFLWYEHELIAESVFFQAFVWAMAGWVAWVSQKSDVRAGRLWWWFFAALAVMVLIKPSTKFLWPGLLVGLVLVGSWKVLRWKHWAALAGLFLVGLTVGDEDQSAWLLYTTAFPLTQLETPLHAEYKAEIRDKVVQMNSQLSVYEEIDDSIHDFLRSPEDYPEYPKWQALAENEEALAEMYGDLAMEGILARPFGFLQIAMQRLAGSVNMTEFKLDRFESSYFPDRLEKPYLKGKNAETMLQIALGLPRNQPLPPFEDLIPKLNPRPDSAAAKIVQAWVTGYAEFFDLLHKPQGQRTPLQNLRPTILGVLVILGAALCLLNAYRNLIGVWVVISAGYLLLVYLVGIQHTRYFALLWPLVLLLAVLPFDALWRGVRKIRSPQGENHG